MTDDRHRLLQCLKGGAVRHATHAVLLVGIVATLGLQAGCTGPSASETRDKAEFHYKLSNGHFYASEIVPALGELETCLRLVPDHPDAHHLMGFIFFGRKEYARAEGHFRKALTVRKGFHQARANLGALLLATRRWREAVTILEPLVGATLYPTPWVTYNNIGLAWEKMGRPKQALKNYRLAVFHNAKFCQAYNNLGGLHAQLGHDADAIDFLLQAAEKCQKFADPHYRLGEIFARQGRHADARRQFDSCFKDAPQTPTGRLCRRRMM
ncbi:MAG: Tfp pilus assembly protein PilF [Myxococcota bacterium]|jgi:Tfp pilus assembly protein PilF